MADPDDTEGQAAEAPSTPSAHEAPPPREARECKAASPLPVPVEVMVDDGSDVCAVCLQHIEPVETAIIKGCEHVYCATCILAWAAFKQPVPLCPQCKLPFDYLFTYVSLDGEVSDLLLEEPLVLLLQAPWFKPSERFGALFSKEGALLGKACDGTNNDEMFEADEEGYFDNDEYEEHEERYVQRTGGGSAAASRWSVSDSRRRSSASAPKYSRFAPRSPSTPGRAKSEEPASNQFPVRTPPNVRSRSSTSAKISSAKAKRLAKAQAKLEKQAKKAMARENAKAAASARQEALARSLALDC